MKRTFGFANLAMQAAPAHHCTCSTASSHAAAFFGCHFVIRADAVIAASIFVVVRAILLACLIVQGPLLTVISISVIGVSLLVSSDRFNAKEPQPI